MKKLKKGIRLIIFLMATAFYSTGTFAQHNHGGSGETHESAEEQSPNGGELKNAGKYKVEIVTNLFQKKDKLSFYLFKGNLKTISTEDVSGTITIKYRDGSTTTEDLVAKGNERFVAQVKGSESFQGTVTFIIKGKSISVAFSNGGIGHQHTSTQYSCPMHPEVISGSPGDCPKCGMKLVKKNDDHNENGNHHH